MNDAKVDQALRLLMSVNSSELTVKEAVGVIELVTSVPELVRETLRIAEHRGLITRKGERIVIKSGQPIQDLTWPKLKIKRTACNDNCRRCGRRIGNCNYIILDDTTIGPFGSGCLKKLKIILS
ncbi:MAG: DUF5830 family protein [Candidatus Hydrothermarchaeaceae archaeon]